MFRPSGALQVAKIHKEHFSSITIDRNIKFTHLGMCKINVRKKLIYNTRFNKIETIVIKYKKKQLT